MPSSTYTLYLARPSTQYSLSDPIEREPSRHSPSWLIHTYLLRKSPHPGRVLDPSFRQDNTPHKGPWNLRLISCKGGAHLPSPVYKIHLVFDHSWLATRGPNFPAHFPGGSDRSLKVTNTTFIFLFLSRSGPLSSIEFRFFFAKLTVKFRVCFI